MCRKYGVQGLDEAKRYLCNQLLRERLVEISEAALVKLNEGVHIEALMGWRIDALKLVSSITLFRETAEQLVEGGKRWLECDLRLFSDILGKAEEMGYPRCNRTINMLLADKLKQQK